MKDLTKKSLKSQNDKPIFCCEKCQYVTISKKDYNKHILTNKHKKLVLLTENGINLTTHNANQQYNLCSNCNKQYTTRTGLWYHNKKCNSTIESNQTEEKANVSINNVSIDIILEAINHSKELQNVLIEQNKELQNKLLEQNKEHQQQILELAKNQSVVNNNNTNTTNQQFNLQFFLNETCKDAMNIVDFINSFQLTTADFETTGKLGFIDGISRIFIKELKKLETEKLPIHCTDFKRETVYIKDNNIWEKENNEKQKLKWTIDRIAQLNLNQLQNWQEKYPECKENNTKENQHFFKLAAVALGGRGKEEEDKYRDKIMKNVLKEVVLDKKSIVVK